MGSWKTRFLHIKKLCLVALLAVVTALFLFPLALTVTNSFMSEGEITANYEALTGGGDTAASADVAAADAGTGAAADAGSGTETDADAGSRAAATGTATSANDAVGSGYGIGYVKLKWIPELVTLSQYYSVLIQKPQFLLLFWNSAILTLPIIAGQIAVASLAAYAFSQLRFRGREPLFFLYIVTMLMPYQVTLVPNFIIADRLGLMGSYVSIIFPGIFGAFGVFLLRQFMLTVPYSYIEAARADGAGHLYIFTRIVLPMCSSGLAALAILLFIDNWNMVEQPLVFLSDPHKQPLSVYLSAIGEGERGLAFAASTLYMLPLVLVALYAERYLVEGIQLSGIKG